MPVLPALVLSDAVNGSASEAGEAEAAVARVRLSEDAQNFFDVGFDFIFYPPPVLSRSFPRGGPRTGSRVSVYGRGLHALLGDASAARCALSEPSSGAPTPRRSR